MRSVPVLLLLVAAAAAQQAVTVDLGWESTRPEAYTAGRIALSETPPAGVEAPEGAERDE